MQNKSMGRNPKKQLRVVFILDEPSVQEGGGAETHAFTLAKNLVKKGHRVSFIVPQSLAWRIRMKAQDGYAIFYVPVPLPKRHLLFSLIYNFNLMAILLLKARRYEIIHVHGARGLKIVAVVSKLLRKQAFVTIVRRLHWLVIFRKNPRTFRQKISNRLILSFTGYIAISNDIKNLLLKYPIPAHKLFYIPNGIEIYQASFNRQELRLQLHLPPTARIVLCVGRLHWQKNIPFMIRAWERVAPRAPDARLILLGDGPLRDEIESLIARRNLMTSVECRGFVNDVPAYLGCAEVFVLPSRMEGCPMAVLEAMGHGLACIVTDSPGNDEIIQHNINGLLVKFTDERDLAESLINLIRDRTLRQCLGMSAQNRIHEHFSIDKICDSHIACYQSNGK